MTLSMFMAFTLACSAFTSRSLQRQLALRKLTWIAGDFNLQLHDCT